MDVEKLIEQLRSYTYWLGQDGPESHDIHPLICDEASTALSTLKAENEKLQAELENYRKGHCAEGGCAAERDRDLVIAENERLRAELERKNEALDFARTKDAEIVRLGTELERAKLERDAAVEQLHGICSACKNYSPYHNRGKCRFCTYEPARDKDAEVNDNWEYRGQKED